MKQLADSDIKEFLENAHLYAWREFKKPTVNRNSLWISEIDAFCEKCGQLKPFQDLRSQGGGSGMAVHALQTGTSYFEFACVSCGKSKCKYLVEQIVDEETIRFQKYGELPKMQLARNPVLQRFLKDDLNNYEKAVVCLSYEYGVAAFAYFRRVVENNINRLLDGVLEDAQSSNANTAKITALAELRRNSPMSTRSRLQISPCQIT